MTSLVVLGALVAIIVMVSVLAPFFVGPGGWLQDAAVGDSLERLRVRRASILKRWLEEEGQHATGMLTDREWSLRQVYLTSRYVDATRRMDWLTTKSVVDAGSAKGAQ